MKNLISKGVKKFTTNSVSTLNVNVLDRLEPGTCGDNRGERAWAFLFSVVQHHSQQQEGVGLCVHEAKTAVAVRRLRRPRCSCRAPRFAPPPAFPAVPPRVEVVVAAPLQEEESWRSV